MSDKAINRIIKITFALALLLVGAGVWYYTVGRKPKLVISTPIKARDAEVLVRSIGANEVLLLVGTKATLYDLAAKKERWSANLTAPAAKTAPATPTPKPIAKSTPPPAAAPQEKPDPLLATRVKKRFAKLEKWAGELNAKRDKLKTKLQIDAFNVEAAKYHAELIAARAEAASIAPPHTAAAGRQPDEEPDDFAGYRYYQPARVEVVALSGSVWIAEGSRVTALNRGDGQVLKSVALPGPVVSLERGAEEVFVVASVGTSREVQVSRIAPGSAATQTFTTTLPPEPQPEPWHEGAPQKPPTPEHRVVFTGNRGSLLQLDVHLKERKLTERQTIPGEAGSELEAADKKTTGGFGNDALVMAQALSREAERDATGGKEIIDESTYEVALRRPFDAALPPATAQVHGRPEVFSTPTLDLIVAGKELLAFDRTNKKLWQATLAQPIAPTHGFTAGDDGEASPSQPCLEAGDRLYFFDTAYLSAFARQTGQPAWRLPLKSIHKVQLDESGHLYVSTQPGGLGEVSQLVQLDAATGRVRWKVEKYDNSFVSGKDLSVTRETRNADDMVNAVFDRSKAPQCRWKLYKLSTRNGEPQWEWFQTRRPSRVEVDHKRVALLFADELQILTSIAL
jgi:hypothetical protein